MSKRYDILFRGDILDGFFLQNVKSDLARLMKIEPEKVTPLFSGRPERIKKGVDVATAAKYQATLEKIGMIVELREVAPDTGGVKKTAPEKHEKVAATIASSVKADRDSELQKPVVEAALGTQLTMAPPGADILKKDEKQKVEAVAVDISHIKLAAQKGNLLHEDERQVVEPVSINLSDYDLAEVGEDLLHDDERHEFVPLEIDLSELTMAEVGADFTQERVQQKVAIPDISHIEIVKND